MTTDRAPKTTPTCPRVYLVCRSAGEGYEVESVWSTREAAVAHIGVKGWAEYVGLGVMWINEEQVLDA